MMAHEAQLPIPKDQTAAARDFQPDDYDDGRRCPRQPWPTMVDKDDGDDADNDDDGDPQRKTLKTM